MILRTISLKPRGCKQEVKIKEKKKMKGRNVGKRNERTSKVVEINDSEDKPKNRKLLYKN